MITPTQPVTRTFALSPTVMLVIVTGLWGLSFPLTKDWQKAAEQSEVGVLVASFTLIALRMALAMLVFALVRPRLFLAPNRREHRIGLAIGVVFFLGFALQTIGLAWTTPALSGF